MRLKGIGNFLERALRGFPPEVRLRLAKRLLATVGDRERLSLGIPTHGGVLENIKAAGFRPSHMVDVGAFDGEWSALAARVFPGTPLLMIEGNPEKEGALRSAQEGLGAGAAYAMALLGQAPRSGVPFFQMETGSSVLEELTPFSRRRITLEMTTLDRVLRERDLPSDLHGLLKIDVQGYELEILRGGSLSLPSFEIVVLEVSLLPYNQGAPLFGEVVAFMQDAGYVAFDFAGWWRRQTDLVPFQTDIVFAREDSKLRAPKAFWAAEPLSAKS